MASPFTSFTTKTTQELEKELNTSVQHGLSSQEAAQRLKQYGPNTLKEHHVTWLTILARQFISPFIIAFILIAITYIILGDTTNALVVLTIISINAAIGFYQEYMAAANLQSLKKFLVDKSLVRRDGQEALIVNNTLVPGDILILYPGDIIPADCRIVEEEGLTIDESELTGESMPSHKGGTPLSIAAQDVFNAHNISFAGTTVSRGKGIAIVIATGASSEIGNIAQLTTKAAQESGLAQSTNRLAFFLFQLVAITLIGTLIINIILKRGTANFSLVELVMFSVSLAVCAIPEVLPIVITFCLAQGVAILARQKVIIKRLSAVEDLGSIDVLCTDKTGTLTENNMSVAQTYGQDREKILLYASYLIPNKQEKALEIHGFDNAIWHALTPEQQQLSSTFSLIQEIPFDPITRKNSILGSLQNHLLIVVRGSVDKVIPLCASINTYSADITNWTNDQEKKGNRVIAIAIQEFAPQDADKAHEALNDSGNLTFIGLISFVDPIKKTAAHALEQAQYLGIKIKILSGDSAPVCNAVAQELNLIKDHQRSLNGTDYAHASAEDQYRMAYDNDIFSRVTPEQKYSIINDLKQHHTVAYLGEGINDAPALKTASVSLSVDNAVDIAREAADIILLQKSLNVIVNGIQEGRKIFINTLKYIVVMLASSFGNFFSLAISSVMLNYLPMLPLQLLLLNLLSDLPMIAIATDSVDPEETQHVTQFDIKQIGFVSVVMGTVSSFFDFTLFFAFKSGPAARLQTSWFIASVLTELALIFCLRTKFFFLKAQRPSWSLIGLSVLFAAITIALPFSSFGQKTFQFITPDLTSISLIMLIVTCYFVTSEVVKLLLFRTIKSVNNRRKL